MKNIENMEVSELFNFIITEHNSYSDKEELSEIISQNISKNLDTRNYVYIDYSKRICISCYLYPEEVSKELNEKSNNCVEITIENDSGFEIKVFYFYGKDISMDTYNRMIKINNFINDILVSMIKKNITEKNIITFSESELILELYKKISSKFKNLSNINISKAEKMINIKYNLERHFLPYKYRYLLPNTKLKEIKNSYDLDCGFKLEILLICDEHMYLWEYEEILEFTNYILENFNKGFLNEKERI